MGGAARAAADSGRRQARQVHPEPELRSGLGARRARGLFPRREPERQVDGRAVRELAADSACVPEPRCAPNSHGRAGRRARAAVPDARLRHRGAARARSRGDARGAQRLQPLARRRLGLCLSGAHLRGADALARGAGTRARGAGARVRARCAHGLPAPRAGAARARQRRLRRRRARSVLGALRGGRRRGRVSHRRQRLRPTRRSVGRRQTNGGLPRHGVRHGHDARPSHY